LLTLIASQLQGTLFCAKDREPSGTFLYGKNIKN
jgi:hypothetical protein